MSTSKPAAGAGGADPSMEDILASIRRILSEDDAPPPAEPQPNEDVTGPEHAPAASPELVELEVIALDASMLVEEPGIGVELQPIAPPPAPPRPAPRAPTEGAGGERERMPAPEPVRFERPAPEPADHGLIGEPATTAAASSVGSLLRTLARERQNMAVSRGGPTLEDLVREEMRPILQEWLNANLPPLVERLVRAEIERVVSRALP